MAVMRFRSTSSTAPAAGARFALSLLLALAVPPASARAQAPAAPPVTPPPAVAEPAATTAPLPDRPPFDEWLSGFRQEAAEAGIGATTLAAALDGLTPNEVIVQRDRAQAEFTETFDTYLERRITAARVRTAREKAREHRALLARVEREYGVPAEVLVAIWGLESNFGRFSGVRPTVQALATLAWDPRRSTLFRRELLDALRIVDRGDIELARMKGSWAGAMGQPQFMPSSYLRFAVDFDGDGRRDIWDSPPDIFASMANYLASASWQRGERWGREVVLSRTAARRVASVPLRVEGCRAVRDLTEPRPLAAWQRLGVRLAGGRALPRSSMTASLVQFGSRRFLVYRNYETLLAYNCAHAYALSVGVLSDSIAGAPPPRPARRRR
jgi:membrane-bound lytic murein transglycosylase B